MRGKIIGLAAALAISWAGGAQAVTRGGTFTFGAFTDVIFFDPVYQQ